MIHSSIQPVIFLGFLIHSEIKSYLHHINFSDLNLMLIEFNKEEYAGLYLQKTIASIEDVENTIASIKNQISNLTIKIETEKLKWVAISQIMVG